MLAMLGEWSKYAEDADTDAVPVLSSVPTPEEVRVITQRMYDKSEERRKLGMMTRKIVQKSFSGDRYLREHEQMLWVGKSFKMDSTQGDADTDRSESPSNSEAATPVEEKIITIPRSAVVSWRSSTSAQSSLYPTRESRTSMVHVSPYGRPSSSDRSYSSTESRNRGFRKSQLPVFAPRAAANYLTSSRSSCVPAQGGNDLVRELRREDLRQYRHSDVSTIMRDDFLSSSTYKNLVEKHGAWFL
jgi:hypothetical protein